MKHFGFGKRLNYRAGDTNGYIRQRSSRRRKGINLSCAHACDWEFGVNENEHAIMGNANPENWDFEEDGESLVDIMCYKVNIGGHYK